MSIISLLNQIKDDEIVLPGIQRDFVWPEDRVYKLLDSIMRGYPIGIVLLWETYEDIQYRSFVRDHKPGALHAFHENALHRKLRLVLDGQQRLQSLYTALYGTLEGKSLYLDILSGCESDDVAEDKFAFEFTTSEDAHEWNEWVKAEASKPPDERSKDFEYEHFVKVSTLFSMNARERKDMVRDLSTSLALSRDDEIRLDLNLSRFDEALSRDENILRVSIIDENLLSDSPYRKSEADVLEVFVRVNREATPLSRSDLVFSMLKLNWKESAEALPEFVKAVNEGNSFNLDTDFVIRCLFSVSDLGTKFDINRLRKRSNVAKVKANFQPCCDAIRATVDFVQTECHCQSSRLIGGDNTMVPFVYYLFHAKNHEVRNDQVANVRKALYMFGLAKPFSRYGDSRLGNFIRWELKPLARREDESFPISSVVRWLGYWERIRAYGEDLLRSNVPLTLHLVQGLTGAKVQYNPNAPEIDHIFPRSELRSKGYDESEINHFANFWILAKGKNQNKSSRHPAEYFKDVDDMTLAKALIDRDMLDYRRYTTFLRARTERILKKVRERVQFTEEDFAHSSDDAR